MTEGMSYTPPQELPQRLKILWRTHKKGLPVKGIGEASELMGMQTQYFGKLCGGHRPVTVESLLKIAALLSLVPTEIDNKFPAWAMHPRAGGDTIDTPMIYTPTPEALTNLQAAWQAYQDKTGITLTAASEVLNFSHTALISYLNGKNALNAEFILKFSTLIKKHPRDFDPAFPAFFLVEITS